MAGLRGLGDTCDVAMGSHPPGGQLRSGEVCAGTVSRERRGRIRKPRRTETLCPKLTGVALSTSCSTESGHFPYAAAPRRGCPRRLCRGEERGSRRPRLARGQQPGLGLGLQARARAPNFLQDLLSFSLSLAPMLSHGNIHKTSIFLSLPILGIVPSTPKLQWLKVLPGVLAPVAREHS